MTLPQLSGTPDGGYNPYQAASQVNDLGSLANYLWGFAPADGRGRMLYLDTFKDGLGAWSLVASGAGSAVPFLTGTAVMVPPFAALLQCGTTGPVGNGFSEMDREFYVRSDLSKAPRFGLEAGIYAGATVYGSPTGNVAQQFPGAFDINVIYQVINVTTAYQATLRIDRATASFQVLTPSGFQQIAGMSGSALDGTEVMYFQPKIVVDFNTGRYVRAVIGRDTIDISALSAKVITQAGLGGIVTADLACWADGTAGHNTGRVGYVLFTADEP